MSKDDFLNKSFHCVRLKDFVEQVVFASAVEAAM